MHSRCLTIALVLFPATAAGAQKIGQFQLRKGQVLEYRVEQTTHASDTTSSGKSGLTSRVDQTKRWTVLEVDPSGLATLQLSLVQLKLKQQLPGGDVLEFDSEKPELSNKQLSEKIAPLIGKPLAVIYLDPTGRVTGVKSSQGPASRFDHELPFSVTLTGKPLEVGQKWTRDYQVALDPPLGAGEKHAAQQTCEVKEVAKGQAKITFATTFKNPPANASDRIPLLQLQPKGEVTFWSAYGLMWNAQITSGGVIEGHAGEGSRYEFVSEYREQLVKYQ